MCGKQRKNLGKIDLKMGQTDAGDLGNGDSYLRGVSQAYSQLVLAYDLKKIQISNLPVVEGVRPICFVKIISIIMYN